MIEEMKISKLRRDTYRKFESVIKSNQPVKITTKFGNAVILSESDFENIRETLEIMNNPILSEKLEEGLKENIEDCTPLEEIGWRIDTE